MVISSKGKILHRFRIWFESFDNVEQLNMLYRKCDEIFIHGNSVPLQGKNVESKEFWSLTTDLTQSQEALWSKATKTVRNEILRAERELVKCKYLDSQAVLSDDSILRDFEHTYLKLYESKGMRIKLDTKILRDYAKNNNFIISAAYIDGQASVYHTYVVGDSSCRLLHSCSEFRYEDSAMRNAIGRANKLLHWRDMLFFKEHGVTVYDWGGISSFDAPNGIDKFKLSFGGEPAIYYNIIIRCSKLSKLFSCIKQFLK